MNMYFIAIVAPEAINEKILQWKYFMKERFGCLVALKSPGHITMIPPFWMEESLENDLVNAIEVFSIQQKNFEIQLRNFSAFKPRVIYVDVMKSSILEILQNDFFSYLLYENKYPLKMDDRPFHPHVTIATRDLYKKSFAEAWEIFSKKNFAAAWEISGISLLRHDNKKWDVIFTSRFPR